MTDKKCSKCGEIKPLDEFHRRNSSKDRLRCHCKLCQQAANKAWREANKERTCATEKAWREANPDRVKAKHARKKKRWPEKVAARNAVIHAVVAGKLIRQSCEICGSSEVHGHHDDYSKPLEVRWLCLKHHTEHHTIGH